MEHGQFPKTTLSERTVYVFVCAGHQGHAGDEVCQGLKQDP